VDRPETPQSQTPAGQALKLRIISGVVMAGLAFAVVYLGGPAFTLLVAAVAALMLLEWNAICNGGRGNVPLFWLQTALVWTSLAVMVLKDGRTGLELIVVGLPLTVVLSFIMGGRKISLALLLAPVGLLYAALPALAIVWLRHLLSSGFEVTLWVFAIVWATDIGGYAAGRSIGGPKLAPKISPKKTWAGLGGGMVLAAAVSVLLGHLFHFAMPASKLAMAAAVLAVWGQVGDLAESALKRHYGVKDSGAIIPGHGGILDRLDGFAFVAPVVGFFLWRMGSAVLVGG
jgi:phosphatidate cytidylyltransferase